MRKAQRRQAENFIEILSQAHLEIRILMKDKNNAAAADLLRQCQEGAAVLGGFIEEADKECHAIISLLEDYCEIVYQCYEKIIKGIESSIDVDEIWHRLCKALSEVEYSLKNDIPLRYEIVFMPYKSSMWDSLESVWQAAIKDGQCDVYVVPIPYYDRKADFSFGQFHYEGGDFPDNVVITDYRSYDLEKRKPDIIYIHNPYDAHNLVTSVAPQFYADKLKVHTECLAYIPYCIYGEPDSPEGEETIEFCSRYITPGLLLSDRVILQSENFRSAIVNTLLRYCGKDRGFWEKKIIALGSPKYDKVCILDSSKDNIGLEVSATSTSPLIPGEWQKYLVKPDGGKKRVIFYNTSLNALLQHGEQMNRKIRSVLACFYEHREECTLLWRPHPLIKATIESMRPALWEEYKKIVDTYRMGGWGIYDDTSDFHGAFAASDAYYGDFSSLQLLYQETGKPLLGQNVDILDYRKRFVTENIYYDGKYIWATALDFNGLFRMNPENCEISYMGSFPEEKAEDYRMFYGIAEYGTKLYFCPYNARHIAVYDKASGEFDTVILKENIRKIDKKFASILSYGRYMYLQGSRAHTIVRLDIETNDVVYIENWVVEMKERQIKEFPYLLQRDGYIYGGYLYYYSPGAGCLLRIRLTDFEYEIIYIQNSNGHYIEMVMKGIDDYLLLLPEKKGDIFSFDLSTLTLTKLLETDSITCSCKTEEYFYFFSSIERCFYRVHTQSKELVKIPIAKTIYGICTVKDKIFLTTYLSGNWYILDTASMEMEEVDFRMNEKEIPYSDGQKMIEENKKNNGYARETGFVNLRKLMETDLKKVYRVFGKEKNCCGKMIHIYMKGLIECKKM